MPFASSAALNSLTIVSRWLGDRVARYEIVVVEIHAVGAELRELLDDSRRRDGGTHRIAERVAADIADGPEAEGELVLRARGVDVFVGHCGE